MDHGRLPSYARHIQHHIAKGVHKASERAIADQSESSTLLPHAAPLQTVEESREFVEELLIPFDGYRLAKTAGKWKVK